MKNIAILGSTGSIGKSTLSVVRAFPDKFRVVGLSVNSDIDALLRQIEEFNPSFVSVRDEKSARILCRHVRKGLRVYAGEPGLLELVKEKSVDQIMFAISGSACLMPLIEAIDAGKDIALANKEALVMAGSLIMRLARRKKIRILPVDSEQSAIWQCLEGENRDSLKRIYLTASGGPLRRLSRSSLNNITVGKVLKHPRWKMGRKITVDSATLMNKGLELLEAMFLFDLDHSRIRVLVHPEALIHSMVEFIDGVTIAQVSITDMRIPIQYALSYPQRLESQLGGVDFYKLKSLNFEKPDLSRFPALRLAYEAAKELGTLPCVMNAANEIAVKEFLDGRIKFTNIARIVEKVMRKHSNNKAPTLGDIRNADIWARYKAQEIMGEFN
jgi:1-deoxy-D-xylulose-5-phosphate reductoisomerase